VLEAWVSLPWAGPGAYYGSDAAVLTRRLESLGVVGVVQGDHPFVPDAPMPFGGMAADCLTVLTTVAAHAQRLKVASLVANVGLQHPYLVVRKFAHLALLYGGDRVYAGLGAGWAARDFDALGAQMPAARVRHDRLEETLRLARELFDEGISNLRGDHVVAKELPLAPRPERPPRLLVGGGSRRILELGGRYADHVDLAPPPRVAGANIFQQKLLATAADVEDSARMVHASGRPLTTSVLPAAVVVCEKHEIRSEEEALCARFGLEWRSLDDTPYVLIGEPERLADRLREYRERIGVDWLIVPQNQVERFASDVMPLVA
jgi:alkanesulfonate monooxygenase SsuD/methylene tetrahydromethanopterin reductase-like flavin-dependent oxidoreductase (luciferase family)